MEWKIQETGMQQFIRKTNFTSVQKFGYVSVVHFNSLPSLSLSCRYLCSISYREYIQLIYGYLGWRRMPCLLVLMMLSGESLGMNKNLWVMKMTNEWKHCYVQFKGTHLIQQKLLLTSNTITHVLMALHRISTNCAPSFCSGLRLVFRNIRNYTRNTCTQQPLAQGNDLRMQIFAFSLLFKKQ